MDTKIDIRIPSEWRDALKEIAMDEFGSDRMAPIIRRAIKQYLDRVSSASKTLGFSSKIDHDPDPPMSTGSKADQDVASDEEKRGGLVIGGKTQVKA